MVSSFGSDAWRGFGRWRRSRGERVRAALMAFAVAMLAAPSPGWAAPLLTLVGTGGGPAIELSWDDIEALPQEDIATRSEYVDGRATFSGPLARTVIGLLHDGQAQTVRMIAANDYAVEVPLADFDRYRVVFATRVNGARLSLRDKGPIWVMYPIDDHAELDDSSVNPKLIWQLVRVELL